MNAERTPMAQPMPIPAQPIAFPEETCQMRHPSSVDNAMDLSLAMSYPSSVDNVMHIPLALSTRRRKSAVKKVPVSAPKSIRFSAPPRAVLGIIQIATDLVMDTEGSLLVAQLPGVEIRHTKVAFRENEICTKTYEQAYADGAIQAAVSSLRWPQKNLQGEDYVTVWGMSCTSISFILGQEKVLSICKWQLDHSNGKLLTFLEFPITGDLTGAIMLPGWCECHRHVDCCVTSAASSRREKAGCSNSVPRRGDLTTMTACIINLDMSFIHADLFLLRKVSSKNEQLLEAGGFELCGTMSLGLTR